MLFIMLIMMFAGGLLLAFQAYKSLRLKAFVSFGLSFIFAIFFIVVPAKTIFQAYLSRDIAAEKEDAVTEIFSVEISQKLLKDFLVAGSVLNYKVVEGIPEDSILLYATTKLSDEGFLKIELLFGTDKKIRKPPDNSLPIIIPVFESR